MHRRQGSETKWYLILKHLVILRLCVKRRKNSTVWELAWLYGLTMTSKLERWTIPGISTPDSQTARRTRVAVATE